MSQTPRTAERMAAEGGEGGVGIDWSGMALREGDWLRMERMLLNEIM